MWFSFLLRVALKKGPNLTFLLYWFIRDFSETWLEEPFSSRNLSIAGLLPVCAKSLIEPLIFPLVSDEHAVYGLTVV
jgi:hypothetical protein